jgi:hypothetical protein
MTEAKKPKPTSLELQKVAHRLGRFTHQQLAEAAKANLDDIRHYVRRWLGIGWIESDGVEQNRKFFKVARPEFCQPVERGTPEGNMWRSMRRNRHFSPVDLLATGNTETITFGLADARAYCQSLARAGYLKVEKKASPPEREAVYRLIRDTGPHAPVPRRVRVLFDKNLDEIAHVFSDSLPSSGGRK